jgi:sRNA-binding carbon storage regulator CsrA
VFRKEVYLEIQQERMEADGTGSREKVDQALQSLGDA